MNGVEWVLNIGILAIMVSQLGVHPATRRRLVLPVVLVVIAAVNFLPGIPTAHNDLAFEAIGLVTGLVLGGIAGVLMRVGQAAGGEVTLTAGWAYAALWIVVIGGRMVFALWATGPGSHQIGQFSYSNGITGPAWTAFFVLMALAMILTRTAIIGAQVVARRAGSGPRYA